MVCPINMRLLFSSLAVFTAGGIRDMTESWQLGLTPAHLLGICVWEFWSGGIPAMHVGGVTPLLFAAFLGSTGGHLAVAHHTIERGAAQARSIQDSGRPQTAAVAAT